jgi:hypothetical protein
LRDKHSNSLKSPLKSARMRIGNGSLTLNPCHAAAPFSFRKLRAGNGIGPREMPEKPGPCSSEQFHQSKYVLDLIARDRYVLAVNTNWPEARRSFATGERDSTQNSGSSSNR